MERKLSTTGDHGVSGWAAVEVVGGQFTRKENGPTIPQSRQSDGKRKVVASGKSGQETQRQSLPKSQHRLRTKKAHSGGSRCRLSVHPFATEELKILLRRMITITAKSHQWFSANELTLSPTPTGTCRYTHAQMPRAHPQRPDRGPETFFQKAFEKGVLMQHPALEPMSCLQSSLLTTG